LSLQPPKPPQFINWGGFFYYWPKKDSCLGGHAAARLPGQTLAAPFFSQIPCGG
jgi:hypothetical protein